MSNFVKGVPMYYDRYQDLNTFNEAIHRDDLKLNKFQRAPMDIEQYELLENIKKASAKDANLALDCYYGYMDFLQERKGKELNGGGWADQGWGRTLTDWKKAEEEVVPYLFAKNRQAEGLSSEEKIEPRFIERFEKSMEAYDIDEDGWFLRKDDMGKTVYGKADDVIDKKFNGSKGSTVYYDKVAQEGKHIYLTTLMKRWQKDLDKYADRDEVMFIAGMGKDGEKADAILSVIEKTGNLFDKSSLELSPQTCKEYSEIMQKQIHMPYMKCEAKINKNIYSDCENVFKGVNNTKGIDPAVVHDNIVALTDVWAATKQEKNGQDIMMIAGPKNINKDIVMSVCEKFGTSFDDMLPVYQTEKGEDTRQKDAILQEIAQENLLRDGHYATLFHQIRNGRATRHNTVGGDNDYKKLVQDNPVVAINLTKQIAEHKGKYLDNFEQGMAFEYMMHLTAGIVREAPETWTLCYSGKNVINHKDVNKEAKEPYALGTIDLCDAWLDVMTMGEEKITPLGKTYAKMGVMQNYNELAQIKGMSFSKSFVKLSDKIQKSPAFTDEEKQKFDEAYMIFRKNNRKYDVAASFGIQDEQDKAFMDGYVTRKKAEILKRRSEMKGEISGAVVADKISEARQSGVLDEVITPEKGNKLAQSIKRKLSQRQR